MSEIGLKSPRARRVLEFLRTRGSATTKEIEDHCQVAAARDWVRRLRDKGFPIRTVERGFNDSGARIVSYQWVKDDSHRQEVSALLSPPRSKASRWCVFAGT